MHLMFWAIAWLLVGIRVFIQFAYPSKAPEDVLSGDLPFYFMADVFTITHDLFWFMGLAIVLDFDKVRKYYLPMVFLAIHVCVVGVIYFILGDTKMAALETTLIAHPFLLYILFWYFHISAKESGRWGTSLVAASFLLWAMDYIVFGIPYFGMGNRLAGEIGWYLGFVFRTMILIGFILMIKSPYDAEDDE